MGELDWLRGTHVVEAGVRQAWPFLTLANPDTDSERRLYIDTDTRLMAIEEVWFDQDDPRLLPILAGLVTLWITEAAVEAGALHLTFDTGEVLVVAGAGNDKTTSALWRLTSDTPGG